jgi:hypothetical protein
MSEPFKRPEGQIDPKFWIDGRQQIITRHREIVPADEPLFLLRARDRNALRALLAYSDACCRTGCTSEQTAGIGERIREFIDYRGSHPERMKEPGSSYRHSANSENRQAPASAEKSGNDKAELGGLVEEARSTGLGLPGKPGDAA